MHRLSEAEACGAAAGEKAVVLTREALSAAENDLAVTLELRSGGMDASGVELSHGAMLKNERWKNEIRRRRDTLPQIREAAREQLRTAREGGKKVRRRRPRQHPSDVQQAAARKSNGSTRSLTALGGSALATALDHCLPHRPPPHPFCVCHHPQPPNRHCAPPPRSSTSHVVSPIPHRDDRLIWRPQSSRVVPLASRAAMMGSGWPPARERVGGV